MSKFRNKEEVIVKATGQKGTVVCHDEVIEKETNRCVLKYMVKLGKGFGNYGIFARKELQRVPKADEKKPQTMTKVYDAADGVKVTMVAVVEVEDSCFEDLMFYGMKSKTLRIGASFYNPTDEYNEEIGFKMARHRAYENPFCEISARFLGEFNDITVEAIMDAKAKYIIENIGNFIKA